MTKNNDIDSINHHLQVEDIARRLVERFNAPGSREFYLKVAYRLPEARIENLVTTALEKGDDPGKLFNFLARKEMMAPSKELGSVGSSG
ncbi:hypothetical protein H0W80_04245 [Candidatus Saccharibacteria bacterium]|nr:hypothetical protein [Candidatus Saccharibacteria bacterium]